MSTTDQTELHNRLAGEIVASIVRPIVQAGGGPTDILVVLESVIAGTVLVVAKLGGDEPVVDAIAEGVKARLATIRLAGIEPGGRA